MGTKIDRLKALCVARGIKTTATTARGLLRALRGTQTSGSSTEARRAAPVRIVEATRPMRELELAQYRARERTKHHWAPLHGVMTAAIAGRDDGDIACLPHAYKWSGMASVTAAVRQGQVIRYIADRVPMPHRSGGRHARPVVADDARQAVRVADLWRTIPKLPRGMHYGHDALGFTIIGPSLRDGYHPSCADLETVMRAGNWDAVVLRAEIARDAYRASTRVTRRATLIERYAPGLLVTREDSLAAGNCSAGTDAWISRAGITADVVPVATLVQLARGDRRVLAAIVAAARRHRAARRVAP